ncbi:hypothetical protein [Bradyrhizobium sp. 21]|uniref:hypothetical protein n=1 Tax=Bradyrhizobium sp. 21 TaxID=2782666 RepID=UPI001FF756A7|nr:hypothetical protein [Bradyrhizobium sp. 21]MCK1383608.1 hypothetical protein [Bradyrhizobium sp. 21]
MTIELSRRGFRIESGSFGLPSAFAPRRENGMIITPKQTQARWPQSGMPVVGSNRRPARGAEIKAGKSGHNNSRQALTAPFKD